MNLNRLIIAASLLLTSGGIAQASRNPTPPPSGVVIHLFGPNSVMSNIVPDLPGETAKRPATGGAAGQPTLDRAAGQPTLDQPAGSQSTASGVESTAAPASANSTDPSWHDVLHQMFVTGDPDAPNKPAPGRPIERQNIK